MNKSIMKAQFKSDYSSLKTILNKYDIIGFMPVPDDEYDCLNHTLLSLLNKRSDRNSIRNFLNSEIKEHFGLDKDHVFIDKLAEEIFVWWNKKRIIKVKPY